MNVSSRDVVESADVISWDPQEKFRNSVEILATLGAANYMQQPSLVPNLVEIG